MNPDVPAESELIAKTQGLLGFASQPAARAAGGPVARAQKNRPATAGLCACGFRATA
jgi:hypothetical protein